MKKRWICAVLFLSLCLSSLGIPVFAENTGIEVTVDGKTVTASPDGTLSLGDLVDAGSRLVYAELLHADGTKTLTVEDTVTAQAGLSVTLHTVSIAPYGAPQARVCTPLGLRFVTEISKADYDAFLLDPNVKKIEIGTLIAPSDDVLAAGELTHAAFAQKTVLDVHATNGRWYDKNVARDTVFYAGSIANVKESHYNLAFSGCGYFRVTFKSGEVKTVYAAKDPSSLPTETLAIASTYQSFAEGLTKEQKQALALYADTYNGEINMLYEKMMKGLNVLAIGDSLFAGAFETVGDAVWVNRLGVEYGWNLTNLGINGATVSYDSNRTAGNKSMYQLLMNDPNYCYGSESYYSCGTPSKDPSDVDLILLEGGTNDYGYKVQAPVGEVGVKDPATLLGAWMMMTEELLDRYPNANIVFVTAWKSANQARDDKAIAAEYTASVTELYRRMYASHKRVYLIDAGDPKVSGITMVNEEGKRNEAFVSEYAYDIFHLNDKGMELMASAMRPLLWEILVTDRGVARSVAEQMRWDLSKLNVLAFGDSLFYGSGKTIGSAVWLNLLGRECDWNITNLGIGGATISYHEERNADRVSIYDKLFNDPHYCYGSKRDSRYYNGGITSGKDKSDVDVIFLQAGSNDYGNKVQAPLGTVGSEDPETFLGAWKLVTDRLLEEYPNATVVLITAWENGNQQREDNANAIEYTSSVVGLYEELYASNSRVKLINAGSPAVSGVDMRNGQFRSIYAYDAFHLNDKGMRLMADNMLPYIWELFFGKA